MSRPNNKARVFDDEEEGAQLFTKKRPPQGRRGMVAPVQDKDEELAQQEQDLDEIHDSIKTIGAMSKEIHTSLQDQNFALGDMDHQIMHTSTGIQQVSDRTQALVQKAGGPRPFMIIGFLLCVALILLVLVLYT